MKNKFKWLFELKGVRGVLLVGSHARGEASKDSDIDLVILTDTPSDLLNTTDWTNQFGRIQKIEQEDWGLVQSLRVHYENGDEIEYGITTREWAGVNPIDKGTREVLKGGHQILFDPESIFKKISEKL